MNCPYCKNSDTKVIDTRVQLNQSIKRRRECLEEICKRRFTTLENTVQNYPMIVKKDKRREEFDDKKLTKGIQVACSKLPIEQEKIEQAVENISQWLLQKNTNEVSADELGAQVMEELKTISQVAYIRFASVYRAFQDIGEFKRTLNQEL